MTAALPISAARSGQQMPTMPVVRHHRGCALGLTRACYITWSCASGIAQKCAGGLKPPNSRSIRPANAIVV